MMYHNEIILDEIDIAQDQILFGVKQILQGEIEEGKEDLIQGKEQLEYILQEINKESNEDKELKALIRKIGNQINMINAIMSSTREQEIIEI